MTRSQAAKECAALSESLWTPPAEKSDQEFLNYLAFEGKRGPYWIADGRSSCGEVTGNGISVIEHCQPFLPALCTQSAPLSNMTYQDNSTEWQTTVMTGEQEITG